MFENMQENELLTFCCADPETGEHVEHAVILAIENEETESLYMVFKPIVDGVVSDGEAGFAARVDAFPEPGEDMTGKLYEVHDGEEIDFVNECFAELQRRQAEAQEAAEVDADWEESEETLTITLHNEDGGAFDFEVIATATNEENGRHYLILDSGTLAPDGSHEIEVVRVSQLPDADGFDPDGQYDVFPVEEGEETEFVQALLEDIFGDSLV